MEISPPVTLRQMESLGWVIGKLRPIGVTRLVVNRELYVQLLRRCDDDRQRMDRFAPEYVLTGRTYVPDLKTDEELIAVAKDLTVFGMPIDLGE